MKYTGTQSLLAALAFCTLAGTAFAHDPSQHARHDPSQQAPDASPAAGTVRIRLPDTALLDQHDNPVRFKTDIVGDRLVVVNFIYTTCGTVCPIQSAVFAELQERLGDRIGKEIAMISVSVDPLRDTPARLKQFAAQYSAGPGWRFVTGTTQAVDEVLTAFNVSTRNFADHPAIVLVGDPRTGAWTRFYGFPGADRILSRMTQLQAARTAMLAAKHH